MVSRRILVAALALGLLSGCTSAPDAESLPDGASLVDASAETLRDLESVRFDFRVSGAIPGLSVRGVNGVAQRSAGEFGYASGEVDVQRTTERTQYEYELSGDRLRLTGQDGEDEELPVPEQFGPARVLDPERGLHELLTQATGLETESREELDDVAAYRVNGELSRQAVSQLVPGVHADVDVKFWVSEQQSRDLLRIWIQVPPRQKNEGSVMIELALSDHNEPIESMRD
ncbi:LppX_LprAFG lipoprotein [Prauserella cavernicola]|uniref:LppX_LprAFG lipoprotein n=1 Tax=Prauserella cavernicola TaxID=2800127 RepID=A0A934QVI3_9PSEU|nr:LppX_LprAFG lipoprotein [Prauserella cavernicola]MBK1789022.1 LppX_LprAFG lipoprotein [Prauserella cavernicola]